MLTIIIPTSNDEAALARMLPPLVSELVHGPVTDVIAHDHGSTDETAKVCDMAGLKCFDADGTSLREVLGSARGAWLLFLPPGAVLSAGWSAHVSEHIERNGGPAMFRPAVDPNASWWQRVLGLDRKANRHAILPNGYLISASQALTSLDGKGTLEDVMRGRAAKCLRAEIHVGER